MDVKTLQRRLRDFAAARDWSPFHSPKNLAMALMVESAELLELFQWLTTEQSHTLTRDPADKVRVEDEIADVLLYLLQLADHTGVDVEQAVERKLVKNTTKHPPKHAEKPAPGPKGHLFVDLENVHPKGEELRALVPEATDVWLFHAPRQKVDASSHRLAYGVDRVTLVPRSGAGANALDFQLSYYIGYITANHPRGSFTVVSNDKGYDPMLIHARELGFDARRVEFHKLPAPVLPAKPKLAPALPVPKRAVARAPSPKVAPVSIDPSASQLAWRAITHLRGVPAGLRPTTEGAWQALLEALIREPVQDRAGLAQRAYRLVRERKLGLAKAPLEPRYPVLEGVVPGTRPVAAPKPAGAQPTAKTIQTTAPAKSSPNKQPAKPVTSVAQPSGKALVGSTRKTAPPPSATQVAKSVLASLAKMPKNKPTRSAGLLKFIEMHACKTSDPGRMAQQVCAMLEANRKVLRSADGKTISYPEI